MAAIASWRPEWAFSQSDPLLTDHRNPTSLLVLAADDQELLVGTADDVSDRALLLSAGEDEDQSPTQTSPQPIQDALQGIGGWEGLATPFPVHKVGRASPAASSKQACGSGSGARSDFTPLSDPDNDPICVDLVAEYRKTFAQFGACIDTGSSTNIIEASMAGRFVDLNKLQDVQAGLKIQGMSFVFMEVLGRCKFRSHIEIGDRTFVVDSTWYVIPDHGHFPVLIGRPIIRKIGLKKIVAALEAAGVEVNSKHKPPRNAFGKVSKWLNDLTSILEHPQRSLQALNVKGNTPLAPNRPKHRGLRTSKMKWISRGSRSLFG